jgi:hypothetical protein
MLLHEQQECRTCLAMPCIKLEQRGLYKGVTIFCRNLHVDCLLCLPQVREVTSSLFCRCIHLQHPPGMQHTYSLQAADRAVTMSEGALCKKKNRVCPVCGDRASLSCLGCRQVRHTSRKPLLFVAGLAMLPSAVQLDVDHWLRAHACSVSASV